MQEDGYRIITKWQEQLAYLTQSYPDVLISIPYVFAIAFLIFSVLAQGVGAFLVLINKKITFAASLLLAFIFFLILIYGFALPASLHHQGRWAFIFRSLSIVGGLLMLIADEKCRKASASSYYFAGIPVLEEPLKMAHALQAAGRLLLAVLCFQFYWHGWVYGVITTVCALSIIVGFGTTYSSLFLSVFLAVANIVGNTFWDVHDDMYDATLYFFFQDLSGLGGLILLLALGPGGLSVDGKKRF